MKSFALFCTIAFIISVTHGEDILHESDEDLIQNEQWFRKFYTCVVMNGPCLPEVKKYTDKIPIYLATNCSSCSKREKDLFDHQKELVAKLYPELFANLKQKFSPTH